MNRNVSKIGLPLGYSSTGIVLAVRKSVVNINMGDKVVCSGAGYADHAGLVTIPRNIRCAALHALRLSGLQPGEYVAVIGAGLIGL